MSRAHESSRYVSPWRRACSSTTTVLAHRLRALKYNHQMERRNELHLAHGLGMIAVPMESPNLKNSPVARTYATKQPVYHGI